MSEAIAKARDFLRCLCRHAFDGETAPFSLPPVYAVIDVETTGFSYDTDLIWSAGWAVIDSGAVVDGGEVILNWLQDEDIDAPWLTSQIMRQQTEMAAAGRKCKLSLERLATGDPPKDGLQRCLRAVRGLLSAESTIAGHNLWRFDRYMLNAHAARFCDHDGALPWDCKRVVDTGLIEKALQADLSPWRGESREAWYRRVYDTRVRVRWSLEPHCVDKYDLARRFDLNMAEAHGSQFDCVLTHALLETYREIVSG